MLQAGPYLYVGRDGRQLYAIVQWLKRRSHVRFFQLDGSPGIGARPGRVSNFVTLKEALACGYFVPLLPHDWKGREPDADVGRGRGNEHHVSGLSERRGRGVQPYYECIDRDSGYCELRFHADESLARDGVQHSLPDTGERTEQRANAKSTATTLDRADVRGGIGCDSSAVLHQRNGRATGHADGSE